MESTEWIPVYHFCSTRQVEESFIHTLQAYGLIEIATLEQQDFLKESQLTEVEKFVRLHYDLGINIEGIEAIGHLLNKIRQIQEYNTALQNRLGIYE